MKFTLIASIFMSTAFANPIAKDKNTEIITDAAFKVIQKRIIAKFRPSDRDSMEGLRMEKSGMIDFLFTSADGKFRGDAICNYSELLMYSERGSTPDAVCPRINVFEKDHTGLNDIGKQVGIY